MYKAAISELHMVHLWIVVARGKLLHMHTVLPAALQTLLNTRFTAAELVLTATVNQLLFHSTTHALLQR
jgi:hypothetical protein